MYRWSFGDSLAQTTFTTTATVTHTTTAAGGYTAVVTATNALGTVLTATTRFTITTPTVSLAPLNSTIQLPNAGRVLTATISNVQAGNTTIGLASSNPVTASVPASVILPAGQGTVTFTVTGHLSGTVAITATLPANVGSNAGSALVTVLDQPITGLTASNNSPTALNSPTDFSAAIATGTNVQYIWNFGDSPANTTPSSDPNASHTTTAAGYYTATVSAFNSIGVVVTASTVYTVDNPLPIVNQVGPSPTTATTTTFTVIGSNFVSGATVEIQLTSGGPITTYTTSFSSSVSLSVTINGADLAPASTYYLWVINPEPPIAIFPRKSEPPGTFNTL
jgi:uncharacterized membrane protein